MGDNRTVTSRIKYFIQKYGIIFSALFSFLSVCSITYALQWNHSSIMFSNSVLSLLFFSAFCMIINKAIKLLSKRLFLYSFLLGWLFSASLIFGTELSMTGELSLSMAAIGKKILIITSLSAVISSLISLFLYYLPAANEKLLNNSFENRMRRHNINERKYFFCIWAIVFLCWIPVFLAYFPGIFAYDTPSQVDQAFAHQLNAHQPVIHTLYLYICMKIGAVFGSYNLGAAIYSLSQMLMLSSSFAYSCYYIRKLKASYILQIAAILFYALLPVNAIFSVNATKDVLFSAAVLYVVLFICDAVLHPDAFFSSNWMQCRLIIFVVILSFLRNNGIYAVILIIPFLIFTFRQYLKKIAAVCLAFIFLFFVSNRAMDSILNVEKGDIGSAFSTPLQQMARTYNYNEDSLTSEEKQALFEIIPQNQIKEYNPRLADYIKCYFIETNFKKDIPKYIKLWIELGLKNPGIYLDAFLINNFGYWYPDMVLPDKIAGQTFIETGIGTYSSIRIARTSVLPSLEKFYNSIANATIFQRMPVFSMLFSPGFAFWFLLLFAGICFYFRRYKLVLPAAILFTLWLTLLLSPIVLFRYAYPICVCIPVMIALLLNNRAGFVMKLKDANAEMSKRKNNKAFVSAN